MPDVSKIRLPGNAEVNIKDSRISGVDNTPTSESGNVVTSGGVYAALQALLAQMISFDSVSTNQDGTLIITLSNGDTITVDLNHNHPQYPKYVHLEDEDDMPASPESDTMYLIDGEGGGGGGSTVAWGTESNNTVPLSVDGTSKTLILSSAKVTSLSSSSTDNQIPSAKCVYDIVGNIETLLAAL